jgi:hypothetical protein
MGADDVERDAVEDLLDDALAEARVVPDLLQLAGVEHSGLEENGVANAQHADVVEEEADLELRVAGQLRRDTAGGELEREVRDALGMAPRVVAPELQRRGERMDVFR